MSELRDKIMGYQRSIDAIAAAKTIFDELGITPYSFTGYSDDSLDQDAEFHLRSAEDVRTVGKMMFCSTTRKHLTTRKFGDIDRPMIEATGILHGYKIRLWGTCVK
jgi:hypothetical protein